MPLARALPAGFTRTLSLCQGIGEPPRQAAPDLVYPLPLRYRGAPAAIGLRRGQFQVRRCAHVDNNWGALSEEVPVAPDAPKQMVAVFESFGPLAHDEDASSCGAGAFGVELDGQRQRAAPTRKRRWRQLGARRRLLARGRANGEIIEIIVSHCAPCGPHRRRALSCPHATRKFTRKRRGRQTPLRPGAVGELTAYTGPIPRAAGDRRLPRNRPA